MIAAQKKYLLVLGKVLILMGLVYIIQGVVDLAKVGQVFRQMHIGYAALSFGVMFLVPFFLAARIALIVDLPFRPIVPAIIKSYFFNNLFVAQIGGDLYKVFYLHNHIAEKKRVVAAVFGDRLIGVTGLLALSIGCVVLGYRYFTDQRVWYALGVYLTIVMAIYVTVFFLPLAWLQRLMGGMHLAGLMDKIEQTRQYVRQIITDHLWSGLALTFAAYGLLIVMNVLIMVALGLKVDALASLLYIPVILIAVLTLPISFNGLGVRESLFILFFQMAGYTSEQALAMALMNLLALLAVSGVGGLLLLFSREKLSTIRAEQESEM